jgi:hypothetical protein
MPKMLTTPGAVLMAIMTVLLGWGLAHAAAPDAANFGQVDVFGVTMEEGSWPCPTPTGTTGTFFDVPGLALSLTTAGGPVLFMVNFNFYGPGTSPGSGFWFEPVIDGQQRSADRLSWQTGLDSEIDVFSYHRAYALPAGAHTFAARMSCQSQITVFRGWMTVYELPLVKPK